MEPFVLFAVLALTLSFAFVLAAGTLMLMFRAMAPAGAEAKHMAFGRREEDLPVSAFRN